METNKHIMRPIKRIQRTSDRHAVDHLIAHYIDEVFEGLPFLEIAATLQLPESTVKSSFYATQKLICKTFKEGSV